MTPKVTVAQLEYVCNVDNLPYLTLDQQILRAVVLDDIVMFDSLFKHTIKYARLSGVLLVKQTLANVRGNDAVCKMQTLDAFLLHLRAGSAPTFNATTAPVLLKDAKGHSSVLNIAIKTNDMAALVEFLAHDAFYASINIRDILKVREKIGIKNNRRSIVIDRAATPCNRITSLIECYNTCVKQRKEGIKKLVNYVDYMNGDKSNRVKLRDVAKLIRIKLGGGLC